MYKDLRTKYSRTNGGLNDRSPKGVARTPNSLTRPIPPARLGGIWFLLLLRLKPQLNKIHNPTLLLTDHDGHSVTPTASRSARNLGFIFDVHLSFCDHISSVSRACFYHIHDLCCMCPVLDCYMARTIGTSFVHSRLDYCNSMYNCIPLTQLNRLQHIQKHLLVLLLPRSSNPDHIIKSLHWLKVYMNALNTKLFPPHKLIQSSYPLLVTCAIS